ncbi:unnamed protein product [Prunus brigantina]
MLATFAAEQFLHWKTMKKDCAHDVDIIIHNQSTNPTLQVQVYKKTEHKTE